MAQGGGVYGSRNDHGIFCEIWRCGDLCDRSAGIYESAWVSGGGDHAACRNVGGKRKYTFYTDDPDHRSGGTYREFDLVLDRIYGRGIDTGKIFKQVSETKAGNREKIGMGEKAGEHRNFFEQADSHDPDVDIHTGRRVENESGFVHDKLHTGNTGLEFVFCRGRLFSGRCRFTISDIKGRLKNHADALT